MSVTAGCLLCSSAPPAEKHLQYAERRCAQSTVAPALAAGSSDTVAPAGWFRPPNAQPRKQRLTTISTGQPHPPFRSQKPTLSSGNARHAHSEAILTACSWANHCGISIFPHLILSFLHQSTSFIPAQAFPVTPFFLIGHPRALFFLCAAGIADLQNRPVAIAAILLASFRKARKLRDYFANVFLPPSRASRLQQRPPIPSSNRPRTRPHRQLTNFRYVSTRFRI